MATSRRTFLQHSAGAMAALSMPHALRTLVSPTGNPLGSAARIVARPVPLSKVRLTGGPLKEAQAADMKYLMSLEPDRMLAYFRIRAGLPQKAEPYDGWDGGGRNLTGHVAGHYLSAVSLMYAATDDARFRQRADYLVTGLKEVQNKNGDGYLCALEKAREAFAALSRGEIKSSAFDLNGLWSPWYTLHKTFAGLRDAYRHTGNKTALEVETKFAGWAERTLAPLNEAQIQQMLNTEQGGMNEVLADLAADTGDERWMRLSRVFEHHAVIDPLMRGRDDLAGLHANCNIPKVIGSAARYIHTGTTGDILAAGTFWDAVADHHSFVTGGMGDNEYFFAADQEGAHLGGRSCESCNVYNMSKLSRTMFSLAPDPYYMDFLERSVFNHALASFNIDDGRMSYMVPVGRGVEQEYQDMQHDFTCCMGTGMENHALHGDGIYYESDDTVWINLFAPSTAELSRGLHLAMETDFPAGEHATIKVTAGAPREFTLAIRRPVWAGDGFAAKVNGTTVAAGSPAGAIAVGRRRNPADQGLQGAQAARAAQRPQATPVSTYVEVRRVWRTGDVVELTLPKFLKLEPARDDARVAAIMWGPLALAADWGPRLEGRAERSAPPPPRLVTDGRPVTEWVHPGTNPGDFTAEKVARNTGDGGTAADVVLAPFYRSRGRRYSIYLDVLTEADFKAQSG